MSIDHGWAKALAVTKSQAVDSSYRQEASSIARSKGAEPTKNLESRDQ